MTAMLRPQTPPTGVLREMPALFWGQMGQHSMGSSPSTCQGPVKGPCLSPGDAAPSEWRNPHDRKWPGLTSAEACCGGRGGV